MANELYFYKGEIDRPTDVIDGDTLDIDIDLGFGVWLKKQRFRLYGIDTPEVRGANKAAGLEVKKLLQDLLVPARYVLVESHKGKEKYGRWLATVWIDRFWLDQRTPTLKLPAGDGTAFQGKTYYSLSDYLTVNGLAAWKEY